MDSSSIELPDSEIESITLESGRLKVHFSRANILKTMTGSLERTRWWQAADLDMEGAEAEGELPRGPLVCAGGDVEENIYTYRDMIPIPLDSRGHTRCELHFRDSDAQLVVRAETVRIVLEEAPKYIDHIRPG